MSTLLESKIAVDASERQVSWDDLEAQFNDGGSGGGGDKDGGGNNWGDNGKDGDSGSLGRGAHIGLVVGAVSGLLAREGAVHGGVVKKIMGNNSLVSVPSSHPAVEQGLFEGVHANAYLASFIGPVATLAVVGAVIGYKIEHRRGK